MSEELLQRGLIDKPEKIGKWTFYNIGATNLKALKENGILKNISYPKYDRRKPDGLIVYKGDVIAVISNKLPKKLVKDKEVKDWIDVTTTLKSKLLIITDAKTTTHWINALTGKPIKDESGHELKTLFDPSHDSIPKLIEQILESITKKNNQLKKPELKDPTQLAKSVWQDLWSVSGDDAENCLYTFVEIFIFKYLSDLNVLSGSFHFDELLKKYEKDTPEQVLEDYVTRIRKEIKKQFKENPDDKTTIINGSTFVNKQGDPVSGYSTVFKKVLIKFKEYEKQYGKFDHIHYEFKSKIFETFLKESISKKNWGQYFTPLKVVRAVVKMAKSEVRDNITICDPACGVGKFLLEVVAENPNKFYSFERNTLKRRVSLVGYDKGFEEKEQKTIILAKANMLIYLSELIREHSKNCKDFSDLFNDTFKLQTKTTLGTLYHPEKEMYELILTNPPYVTSGSSNLKEEIKANNLQYDYSISALGIEGLFMQWIVKALKPEGKAFVVVPDGILNRVTDKHLRKFITDECFIDAIISLPSKTFFTTIKKTYILAITKKRKKSEVQKDPVFTYLVSEIGETLDVYRFDIDENHLDTGAGLFNQFKNDQNNFKTSDPRCKIQPIKKFAPDQHWSVDRWWTPQEQIDLGIITEEEKITLDTFSDFIGEIANSILEFQNPLKELGVKKNFKSKYKSIKLSDKNYFDIFIGKRIVLRDVKDIKGTIPAYSGNVFNPVAHITKSNIADFSLNSVLWSIDNSNFDFNLILKNIPFATTDHCGTIRIKSEKILPTYLLSQLYDQKNSLGFDRGLRASLKNMRDVEIKIPVNDKGELDKEIQTEISNAYSVIQDLKQKIRDHQSKLDRVIIEAEQLEKVKMKEFELQTLFDFVTGKSKYTQTFLNSNRGNYPVYSSNTKQNGLFGNITSYDHDMECLQLTTNGVYAGTFFYRHKHKFSINADAKLLVRKNENLDYQYFLFELKNVFKQYGFNWENKPSHTKIAGIKIKVPVKANGEYDLKEQKAIANKFQAIENIKAEINKKLEEALIANVSVVN